MPSSWRAMLARSRRPFARGGSRGGIGTTNNAGRGPWPVGTGAGSERAGPGCAQSGRGHARLRAGRAPRNDGIRRDDAGMRLGSRPSCTLRAQRAVLESITGSLATASRYRGPWVTPD